MDKNEKIVDKCLKEMFKRVGEKYPNKKLTNKPEWYTMRTWTMEEEDSFRKWMKKIIRKEFKYMTDKKVDLEVAMFLLQWGWKCSDYGFEPKRKGVKNGN